MSINISPEFRAVNREVETLLREHPRAALNQDLGEAFLQVDQNPKSDLRVQLSHGGEQAIGTINDRLQISRVSVTGVMETTMTPERGWHVFDLLHDGVIQQMSSPSNNGEQIHRDLEPDQMSELANWLQSKKSDFLAN